MKNKLTCAIVDDEPLARNIIKIYLKDFPEIHIVNEFKNAYEAKEFLTSNSLDFLFLDIQMPKLTGIEMIKQIPNHPLIVFTTAHHEHATEAFDLGVTDYLLKPFSKERFGKAIKRVQELTEARPYDHGMEDTLLIRSNYSLKRIPVNNILYIQAMKEYIKIVQKNQLPDLVYMRLKDIMTKLGPNFIRIHKSYLVNVRELDEIRGEFAVINEEEIKISRNYKKQLLNALRT